MDINKNDHETIKKVYKELTKSYEKIRKLIDVMVNDTKGEMMSSSLLNFCDDYSFLFKLSMRDLDNIRNNYKVYRR